MKTLSKEIAMKIDTIRSDEALQTKKNIGLQKLQGQ